MTEKLRPLPEPVVDRDGSLVVHSVATPEDYDIRGAVLVGSTKVIPVVFVPGIMGTNLRVRRDVQLPKGMELKPGEAAWRPPNDPVSALSEKRKWERRNAAQRQLILHADYLEVDGSGEIAVSNCGLSTETMRARGWGEIFTGSYGALLFELQSHLDRTFRVNALREREIRPYWKLVMDCAPSRWGVKEIDHITKEDLEKYAQFQYPVYAVGYNWLQSCAMSANRLATRVREIVNYWRQRRHQCDRVILVTHSMGGLVARAAAKQVPDLVLGVIHGVMPALGAPVAYRRLVAGTESSSPTNGASENLRADIFATIAGRTTAETTPVMAISPGVLQLLPTHEYPGPWLFARVFRGNDRSKPFQEVLSLPQGNPYDMYRDTTSWYRLVDPTLVDPADIYSGSAASASDRVKRAVAEAERFHTKVLSSTDAKPQRQFYHPNTYAYFGADANHRSFGRISWVAHDNGTGRIPITANNLRHAVVVDTSVDGARTVEVEGKQRLRFELQAQDAPGDDTVPSASGAGPEGRVKQVFKTTGYSHQDSYSHSDMLLLTRHLIVKMVVQEYK